MTTSFIPLSTSGETTSFAATTASAATNASVGATTGVPSEEEIAVTFDAVLQQVVGETAKIESASNPDHVEVETGADALLEQKGGVSEADLPHPFATITHSSQGVDEVLAAETSPAVAIRLGAIPPELTGIASQGEAAQGEAEAAQGKAAAHGEATQIVDGKASEVETEVVHSKQDVAPEASVSTEQLVVPKQESPGESQGPEVGVRGVEHAVFDPGPANELGFQSSPSDPVVESQAQPVRDSPSPVDVARVYSEAAADLPEPTNSPEGELSTSESSSDIAESTVENEIPTAQKVSLDSTVASAASATAATIPNASTAPVRKPGSASSVPEVPHIDLTDESLVELPKSESVSSSTEGTSTNANTEKSESLFGELPSFDVNSSPAAISSEGVAEIPISVSENPVTENPVTRSTNAATVDTAESIESPMVDTRAGLTSVRGDVVYRSLPGGMGEQVIAAVHQTLNSGEGSSEKAIFLELQPAELGRLRIRVEQGVDSITTHIVASEASSGDLLSSRRDTLQNALTDLGFGDASVDISNSQDGHFFEEEFARHEGGRSFHSYPGDGESQKDVRVSHTPRFWFEHHRIGIEMEGSISSQLATVDYLELLTIQLRNQDPIDPVDQEGLINDLTQFSMLEGVEDLNATFADVLKIQELGQGLDFIGKTVNYRDANDVVQSGRVSEMFNSGDEVTLLVNGESVPVSRVLSAGES